MITDSRFILDIVLFVVVAEQGNFTQAADKVGLSKSSVSKRISRLEENLGVQLLHRTTRQVTLSEAGELFYQRCSAIKEDIELAIHSLNDHQTKPRGVLRISSPVSFARYQLTPILAEFMQQHKELQVELFPANNNEDLFANNIDVAIRIGELVDSSLHARRIATSFMRVCAAPGYLEKHGQPLHPEQLMQHNCLHYQNSPAGKNWEFKLNKKIISIPVNGNFSAMNSSAVREAAIAGLGIAMLPGFMCRNAIRKQLLIPLFDEHCAREMSIYAVYPPTRYVASKVRAFIDYLAESFNEVC